MADEMLKPIATMLYSPRQTNWDEAREEGVRISPEHEAGDVLVLLGPDDKPRTYVITAQDIGGFVPLHRFSPAPPTTGEKP
ncbi:MAG: hypothetical protein WC972_04970 [Trueperaceae bacterium]